MINFEISNKTKTKKEKGKERKKERTKRKRERIKMSGVVFPAADDGKRSTTAPSKRIWKAAFENVDASGVEKIIKEKDWRHQYNKHVAELTRKSADTPEKTIQVAQDGLKAIYEEFEFVRDEKSMKLTKAMETLTDFCPATGTVESKSGKGVDMNEALSVKDLVKGETHTGNDLIEKLSEMREKGQVEQDVVDAVRAVLSNGQAWREELKDTYFVIFGATSELCPLERLLGLGLNVVAIARPNATRQKRLIDICEAAPKGAKLLVPIMKEGTQDLDDAEEIAKVCGADIITHTPEIRNWLLKIAPGKRLAIGSYIYLDGGNHVRASVAMDAVTADIIKARKETAIMYLGSPATVYPIPRDAYEDSEKRRKSTPFWHNLTGPFLGPYTPNCEPPVVASSINEKAENQDKEICLYDGLGVAQGPNYATAKTLQHWRCVVAREVNKCRVSINMAPTCATDSVMHVATFARVVRGMKVMPPLTYFEPDAARAVMTLMLIYDLCSDESAANPDIELRNPMDLFTTLGVHGGLWRCPHAFKSFGKTAVICDMLNLA